eukprot:3724785-Rhodomonas_salina.1
MAEQGDLADIADDALKYDTYEQYLDSQISPMDLYYLDDQDLARQLVELGYRGSGETLKREEFEARKKAAEEAKASKLRNAPKKLASAEKDLSHFPFLHNLAEREDLVRNGKLTSIIFLRDKNSKGQEVSGYIDYAHRLKTENFEPYFERKKRLMPKPSDLSYYNWETQHSTSNSTPNFQAWNASCLCARSDICPVLTMRLMRCQVIADNEAGLLFKNKRDRK